MKLFTLFFACTVSVQLQAQQPYFQQDVSYNIKASLDDKERSITGFETIVYKNNSTTTLDFIWFHLWANAYKDKTTALYQQISTDEGRSKKIKDYGTGYIEGLDFKINGQTAKTGAHPNVQYIDIIKVLLNSPLKPGDSISISTPFKVILPPYFSRSGYADGEFMACQWYPKPAVFDRDGWHEFPYLDMGEFYSEFGNYRVSITLPAEYIVSATGNLLNQDELAMYKKTGAENLADREGKPSLYKAVDKKSNKTLNYYAEKVPDFAWFADKDFVIQYDTIALPNGRTVDAFSFYHNKKKTLWNNSMDYIKDGLKTYSSWIGNYDYPVVQVVEGPKNNSSGGMEYPMVTLITSPDAKLETLDAVITHEIGHNWFMGMLGSNERAHTWMDEGLNSYFQFRYEAEKYRANSVFGDAIPEAIKKLPADEFLDAVYKVINDNIPMKSAMDISAEKFPTSDEYGLVSYVKTAVWMHILETSIGWDKVKLAVQNYYAKWKFKHPGPGDMQAAFEEAIGAKLNDFFSLVNKEGKFD
ncbi:MAG: M1 family metallopeptidase [Ferruginibacter sp.]